MKLNLKKFSLYCCNGVFVLLLSGCQVLSFNSVEWSNEEQAFVPNPLSTNDEIRDFDDLMLQMDPTTNMDTINTTTVTAISEDGTNYVSYISDHPFYSSMPNNDYAVYVDFKNVSGYEDVPIKLKVQDYTYQYPSTIVFLAQFIFGIDLSGSQTGTSYELDLILKTDNEIIEYELSSNPDIDMKVYIQDQYKGFSIDKIQWTTNLDFTYAKIINNDTNNTVAELNRIENSNRVERNGSLCFLHWHGYNDCPSNDFTIKFYDSSDNILASKNINSYNVHSESGE